MVRLAILVVCLLPALVSARGVSADSAVPPNIGAAGDRLILAGEIRLETFYAAEALLSEDASIRRIDLDSPGGSIHAARGLARLVREGALATHVTGRCNSACTLVFVSGTRRTMAADASLGFHGYDAPPLPLAHAWLYPDAAEQEATDRAYFLARGVDPAFVARIFETPHESLWRPSRHELLAAGVLTE